MDPSTFIHSDRLRREFLACLAFGQREQLMSEMGGKRTLDCPRFAEVECRQSGNPGVDFDNFRQSYDMGVEVECRQSGNPGVDFDNFRQSYDMGVGFSVCAQPAEELPVPVSVSANSLNPLSGKHVRAGDARLIRW